jgi:hypothetical protein
MPPMCCLPTVEFPDAPLSSPGSSTVQVPRFPRYYQGAMTSCRPFRRASFPSLGDTTRSARVSPARGRALPRAGLPELVTRYLQPGFCQWRRQDLLRSWGTQGIPGTPYTIRDKDATDVGF